MPSETVGQELKRVRQSKKLTIRQVVEDTKISTRHLEALESDTYHSFPGETYVLGFLRSYALYLGLEENRMVQKYKNEKMMQIQTPIRELTQKPVTLFDHMNNYIRLAISIVVVLLAGFLSYYYFSKDVVDYSKKTDTKANVDFNIQDYLRETGKVPEEKTDSVGFANGILITLIRKDEGINFLLQGNEIYLILKGLEYEKIEGNKSRATLVFYPGKESISLSEEEPNKINFPWLPEELRLHLLAATPNNIKMRVEKLGKNENFDEKYLADDENLKDELKQNEIINPDNFTINLVVKTTGENYVEFYIDGKQKKRGILTSGEVLHFEANDSIQMKIGDAGAIEVIINGKSLPKGRRGQQINKIIRKVKDPLEQLKYRLEIKDT